jgi:hypothetical protein
MNDKGINTYIDVTVVHPAAPSNIRVRAVQLQHTVAAEKSKIGKYREYAQQHYGKFIPFAVETYGGIGEYALQVVQQITESAMHAAINKNCVFDPAQLRRELLLSVAVAIQRGNANIITEGYRRYHAAANSGRLLPGLRQR